LPEISNVSHLTFNCSSVNSYEAPYFDFIFEARLSLNNFHSLKSKSLSAFTSDYLNNFLIESLPFNDFPPL